MGVSLNLPPFLGASSQMAVEDVVKTQEIASFSCNSIQDSRDVRHYESRVLSFQKRMTVHSLPKI